jgi:hypothetical protein
MPGIRNAIHEAQMAQLQRERVAVARVNTQAQARTTQPNQRGSPEDPSPQVPSGQPRHQDNVRDTPTARGYKKKTRKSRKRRKGKKTRKSKKLRK